jgi:hypothetical protein
MARPDTAVARRVAPMDRANRAGMAHRAASLVVADSGAARRRGHPHSEADMRAVGVATNLPEECPHQAVRRMFRRAALHEVALAAHRVAYRVVCRVATPVAARVATYFPAYSPRTSPR